MKILFLLVTGLFGLSLHAAEAKYAELGKIPSVSLSQAKGGEAKISLTVMKGYHIQANPASNPQLIATTLTVESTEGLQVGKPEYPAGKVYKLAATGTEVLTYAGKIEIKVPVTAGPEAKAGKHELVGKLRFQACDDKICYFPKTLPIKIPVTVN